jgi:hypothetical protein
MASLEVDIVTYSDADFNLPQTEPFANGLTSVGNNTLHMQVRTLATDPTVWLEATTANGLLTVSGGGATIAIYLPQSMLVKLPPGSYVYSLIMSVLTGLGTYTRTEVFRGTMTHNAGPTQWTVGTL